MKIGVMVESFRLGLEGGLEAAAALKADGVQMYAVRGQTHPDNMNSAARSALRRRLSDLRLEMAAVCGDFGGHGFTSAEGNPQRIEDSKKVMALAVELGCHVVTTHIGVVPADKANPRYKIMADACEELGRFGDRVGACFAIETGPEPAAVLRAMLDDIGLPQGIGVNFDPANLAMVLREDIPQAVATLAPYIVHTHAKDGKNLRPVNAEMLYRSFAERGIPGFSAGDYIQEVPLGEGSVNFPTYIAALRKAGYNGYLTIEREVGADPRKDIELAVKFLRTLSE